MASGFIYVLTNDAWPGWVKVGITQDPHARLITYNVNDPLKRFEYDYITDDEWPLRIEQEAHRLLRWQFECGAGQDPEWFKCSPDDAKAAIRRAISEAEALLDKPAWLVSAARNVGKELGLLACEVVGHCQFMIGHYLAKHRSKTLNSPTLQMAANQSHLRRPLQQPLLEAKHLEMTDRQRAILAWFATRPKLIFREQVALKVASGSIDDLDKMAEAGLLQRHPLRSPCAERFAWSVSDAGYKAIALEALQEVVADALRRR